MLAALSPSFSGTVVDCTVDGAGHAEALLRRMSAGGRLVGIDRDERMLRRAGERLAGFGDRVLLAHGRFSEAAGICRGLGVTEVAGVLMDLGMSTVQLSDAGRGFSFMRNGPLDMRMDCSRGKTAADLIREMREADLARIIWDYGEERAARRIARALVSTRAREPVATTLQLADIVVRSMPGGRKRTRIHPATRTFQALRIAVNDELEELRSGLEAAWGMLGPGGRMCVISYHSLEDREAKRFLRSVCPAGEEGGRLLTKKPLRPSPEEVAGNPAARSARLRAAEKVSR